MTLRRVTRRFRPWMGLLCSFSFCLCLGNALIWADDPPPDDDPPCANPPDEPDPCEEFVDDEEAYDCCTGDTPPEECCDEDDGGGSSNPFNPYSGMTRRILRDLHRPAACGRTALGFTRYQASRWQPYPYEGLEGTSPFGDGGYWRHSFQWDILDAGVNGSGYPIVRLIYPNCRYGNFAKTAGNTNHMTYLARTYERVWPAPDGTNFFLIMRNGTKYHFTGQTGGAGILYRMEEYFDPYSNRYCFTYASGLLARVTGPNTNQYLDLHYTTITNSQPEGLVEFYYADGSATQVLLAGTFSGWTGMPMAVSGGSNWTVSFSLAKGFEQYKFIVRYPGSNDVWKLDPDNELWCYDATFNPNSVAVIDPYRLVDYVTLSDGRTTRYEYGWVEGKGKIHVCLNRVAYGDGTSAEYSYYHPSNDLWRRPLLKTADDPLYKGPARAITYIYQTNNLYSGQIFEERNLVTSQLLARLEITGARPEWRRVTRGDGAVQEYTFSTNTGRRLTYTNAVGYSRRASYYWNNDGMRAENWDPQGRRTTYQRTLHFGTVTIASNDIRGIRRYVYSDTNNPFFLSAQVDEAGRTNSFTRDSRNRITRHDYPDGTYETFAYNEYGQILTNRLRDGGIRIYAYDDCGRKLYEIDPGGNQTSYSYDEHDRLAGRTNALGYATLFFNDWRGQVTNVVHADGTEEKTWYDKYGQPTQRLDRAGGLTALTYDDLGHMTVARNSLGTETYYRHDVEGRLITGSNALGLVVSNAYDGMGRKIRETFSTDGTYREWHYDPDGVRTQYNRLGLPTTFAYDPKGRLQRVTDPLNRTVSFGYDAAGNRTYETNALGEAIVHTYDPAGRVTSTRDCEGNIVSNVYDEAGRLVQRIDANSNTNAYTYDALGRLLCLTRGGPGSAPALLQTNSHNALGWIVTSTDANNLMRSNTYDVVGRPLRTYMPDGTYGENQYSNTFLVKTLDRAGRQTVFQRDILGRVTNQVDNAGQSVRFVYDSAGNLTDLYDQNGSRTRFQYDAEGRQTAKIYADDTQYTYGYDDEGRVTSKLDAKNKTTAYQYDYVGNLTNIVYATDPAVSFTYDALNRMTRMVDGIGTTLYAYAGSCGALASEDGPFQNDTLYYEYDNGKRLLSVTSALYAASYSYDALDRITNAVAGDGPPTARYSYHANGRLPSDLIRGNGTRTRYEYDNLNRLTNLVHETDASEVPSSFAYTLDNADQRIGVHKGGAAASPTEITYAYDPIGQLIGAESDQPGHSFAYSYDPAGNPVQQDNNGFVLTNAFNDLNQNVTSLWSGSVTVMGTVNITNGQITVQGGPAASRADGLGGLIYAATNLPVSDGTNTYTALLSDPFDRVSTSTVSVIAQNRGYGYDANGNMTNDGQFVYVWDDSDRLTEVRKGNEVVMTCRYDGLGRRRERILSSVAGGDDPGSTNRYVYKGWLVIAVLDGSDQVIETYTHGPDLSGTLGGAGGIGGILHVSPLLGGAGCGYFHYDGNGNVIACTDTNQTIAAALEYGPFGTLLTHSGPFTPRYRFSSKEWDDPAGLYYYGYRYYNPRTGRWISRDPEAERGGVNLLGFVLNDPVQHVDVDGRDFLDWLNSSPVRPGTGQENYHAWDPVPSQRPRPIHTPRPGDPILYRPPLPPSNPFPNAGPGVAALFAIFSFGEDSCCDNNKKLHDYQYVMVCLGLTGSIGFVAPTVPPSPDCPPQSYSFPMSGYNVGFPPIECPPAFCGIGFTIDGEDGRPITGTPSFGITLPIPEIGKCHVYPFDDKIRGCCTE